MKKWMIIILLALVLIAIGLFQSRRPDLEFTTDSAEAHSLYEEGNTALFALQWEKAMSSLEKAVALDPDFVMARAALATAYRAWGHPEEGQVQATIADSLARLLPDDDERMLVQLRLAAYHNEEYEVADSLLTLLQTNKSDNLIVLATRANLAERIGNRGQSEQLWQRLLEVNPNFAHAYNMLGYGAARRGSYDEAVDLLQKYTYLAPDVANAHDSLGEVLTYTGRYEEAEKEFRAALKLQPDFYASLVNMARIYFAEGRIKKGQHIMDNTGKELAGSDVELRFLYLATLAYIDFNMPDKLNEVAKQFINLYPEERYCARLRIFTTAYRGDFALARSLADSLVLTWEEELFPVLTEPARQVWESFAFNFEAIIAHYEGLSEVEVAAWEQALRLAAPLSPHELISYRNRFSLALLNKGRNLEALEQAQLILDINPRVIPAMLTRTEALLKLGEREKAEKALEVLEQALQRADADYPPLLAAQRLREAL